ncbi:MAG TPA: glycosyltransferase family 4 protein [Acidimicrobiales bacterium]|nr:glycosyltransferase family 4 protein [Acidimicrobiales bacterium]
MTLRIVLTHVCAWPEVRRGTERYLHELGAALAAAGHDVAILTTTPGPAGRGVERGVPVRYLHRRHVLRRRFGDLSDEVAFGGQALATLGAARLDVWHAMGTADAAAAAFLGRVRGVCSVYTDHGFPYRPSRQRRPDRRLHDSVVAHVDRYVCVSEAAGQALVEGYGRAPDVISGGVDLDRFSPGSSRHHRPVLLFAGDADESRKNLPLLARAIAALRAGGQDVELWVAGPGDQRRAVADTGLPADAVRLLGTVDPDALVELYRSAWVTVLPARAEAFGLVLVESLACGTPVVALDEGGPRDIVRPGIGLLAAEGVDDLAAAGAEAIDLAAAADTVERCRSAAQAWDWRTAIVPRLERLYGL